MLLLNKNYSRYWIYASILGFLLVLFFVPVDLPYIIKTSGKLLSANEWMITRGTDGRLLTNLIDNRTGINKSLKINVFERGDAVQFKFSSSVNAGSSVLTNDTVATIYSSELEESLAELKGSILTEKASLASIGTGEKTSIINAAEQNIIYAETKVEEQINIVKRNKKLFEADLLSEEDYDISVSTLQLFYTNIAIAKEQLATVMSGAKEEQIKYIEAKIKSLEEQIDIVYDRAAAYNFISPIDGVVSRTFSQDTLLLVTDRSEYVVVIPVLFEELYRVKNGQNVEINISHGLDPINGKVISTGNTVHQIGSHQVVMVIASFNHKNEIILPGLLVKSNIYCGDVSLLEFVKNWFIRLLA